MSEPRDEVTGLGDRPMPPPAPSPQGDGHPGSEPAAAAVVVWPERPTCHDADPHAQRFGPTFWREPRPLGEGSPYRETFRTCSYCGSIHPEDLYRHLTAPAGAELHGADWKYGWPHKFYVEGIPNPAVGQPVPAGFRSWSEVTCPCGTTYQNHEHHACPSCAIGDRAPGVVVTPKSETTMHPAPPTLWAKWYNAHLADLTPAGFALLAPLLEQHAGIAFTRDADGRIAWSAPSYGYQR
jgi:hypothetical protein